MNNTLGILLIHDNPDDRALVIRELRREFPDLQVQQIIEAEGLAQALEAGDFDLVITDYQLRWTDGLAVLRAAKDRYPDRPVVMFTATGSEEIAVEAMKAGLDDYVLKSPKHFVRLPAAVRYALKRAEDITARKRAEEALRELNATLEERVRQRAFELQVLYELSQQIGYTLNYEDLFRLMIGHLHRVLVYDVSASLLVTGGVCELFIRPTRPLSPAVQEELQERLVNTFATMSSQSVDLEQLNTRLLEVAAFDETASPIARLGSAFQVPLIVGEEKETVGLLFVGSEQEGAFTEDQVRVLYTVANQASSSIQRLRALLAAEQRRLEALVERLPEGVLLLDAEGRIVLANPAGREYLPLLADVGVGDVLAHLGGRPIEELLRPPPAGSLYHEVEVDGPPRTVFEVKNRPMKVGPESRSWVLVIRDVTAEREVQERIQQWSKELERKVEERTKDLEEAQERLLRAERLAAIGQLGASVAHELRNPLGVIKNSAYYLNMKLGHADENVRKHVGIIEKEIARSNKIISALMDFARVREPTLQETDVNFLVKEALSRNQIPREVVVVTKLTEGLPPLMADPDQIEQVFINMISNAVQAMTSSRRRPEDFGELSRAARTEGSVETPDGGRLEIATKEEDGFIVTEFKDNGCGIPEENLEKIFEPLFTTKAKGIGLGLPLSKLLIEAHKGTIEVESPSTEFIPSEAEGLRTGKLGKGTTFSVRLPLEKTNKPSHPIA